MDTKFGQKTTRVSKVKRFVGWGGITGVSEVRKPGSVTSTILHGRRFRLDPPVVLRFSQVLVPGTCPSMVPPRPHTLFVGTGMFAHVVHPEGKHREGHPTRSDRLETHTFRSESTEWVGESPGPRDTSSGRGDEAKGGGTDGESRGPGDPSQGDSGP